ncbi:MAG TPA: thiamine diphosphokinase [Bacteroidales bacterium]|nr:thiamine diphosphokinase [Bacteroidales bacterium]
MQALILADGSFPTTRKRQELLRNAENIVCCDGATAKLLDFGREPLAIVGDMDSLSSELKAQFTAKIHLVAEQETNDLTKAVEYCITQGFDEIAILGATGLREDHTLGNISLLADYATRLKSVCLLTDYGRIDAFRSGMNVDDYLEPGLDTKAPEVCTTRDGAFTVARFQSFKGQQVSIFSLTPDTRISSLGLRYALENRSLTSWWQGTLNESAGDQFSLSIDQGVLLIYRIDQ